MNEKKIEINITTGTLFRAILLVLLVLFLYLIRDIVAVVLFSVVVASGVEPAARWFQRYKIPRTIAVIFVYLIAFAVLAAMFYLVIPTMFSELSVLADKIPSYIEQPFQAKAVQNFLPGLPETVSQLLLNLTEWAKEYVGKISVGFFQAASIVFGGALSFVLIVVLSFYLAVQERGIENFLRIITPAKHEEYIVDLWFRSREKIGSWLKGQILLGLLIGVLVFLGLTFLRVEYALTFALLAGVFELIPIFGPVLAAIPPVAVAFLQSPALGLGVIALYVIIQQFENHLIYPLVVKKAVGVPPIITILALIIGGKVGGFMGILLSVPLVSVLFEYLGDIERRKKESRHH